MNKTGLLLSVIAVAAFFAQTTKAQNYYTEPGGMSTNGNYFVIHQNGTSTGLYEWLNDTNEWAFRSWRSGNRKATKPGARTATGGVHYTVSDPDPEFLVNWEPGALGGGSRPPLSEGILFSTASDVKINNRLYAIVGANAGDGIGPATLFEHDLNQQTWTSLGKPKRAIRFALDKELELKKNQKPCVLNHERVFVSSYDGELCQWVGNGTSGYWINHGVPEERGFWFWGTDIGAKFIGAAMPETSKVFMTCTDGSLRQFYWDGTNWRWQNHGRPFGGLKMISAPVSIAEGKLFVIADYRLSFPFFGVVFEIKPLLLELHWNGTAWAWRNHGRPPGVDSLYGNPEAAYGGHQVVVQALDSTCHVRWWDNSVGDWVWKSCGKPQ